MVYSCFSWRISGLTIDCLGKNYTQLHIFPQIYFYFTSYAKKKNQRFTSLKKRKRKESQAVVAHTFNAQHSGAEAS